MQVESPKEVLFITIGDGSFGGVANFLYTFYSHIDHRAIHADFLYCGRNSMKSKEGSPELEGSRITTLNLLKPNNNGIREYRKLLHDLKEYFSETQYRIVHVNSSNIFLNVCVAVALKGRAKLISHSHNTQATIEYANRLKKALKTIIRIPCQAYIRRRADALVACSMAAGVHLFGQKGVFSTKFKLIHNAIDLSCYQFNSSIRQETRKNEMRMTVGHVGRLTDQKNPLFLLDVFKELHQKEPNSVLWMIGEGELKDKILKRIEEMHLQDCVELLGRRSDVPELLQAMDVFLFPSFYEGLSIVTIEAQAAGLPIFASDSISAEHKVTDLVHFLSLEASAEEWASRIIEEVKSYKRDNHEYTRELACAGYEIKEEAKVLQDLYLSL